MTGRGAYAEILADVAQGALVLTATRRLARRLRGEFDAWRIAEGDTVWPAPAILSGDAWLRKMADRLGEADRLLAPSSSRCLWETLIGAKEPPEEGLLQVAATARAAEEAHRLLCDYQRDLAGYALTADHESFLHWRSAYLKTCRREGWLDHSALAEVVLAAVEDGKIPPPPTLRLLGYDDLPPQISRISAAFVRMGSKVLEAEPDGDSGVLLRQCCEDAADEVRRAARWARGLLEAGEEDVGIVVPDLQGYRPLIESTFREEIDPEAVVRPGTEEIRFNLSMGEPLSQTGPVAAALECLAVGSTLPLARASYLLRSPYLGGAEEERFLRARLERELRQNGGPAVTLADLKGMCRKGASATSPGPGGPGRFGEICETFLGFCRDREERLPGAWAGEFDRVLLAIGWPGERGVDSRDYQAVKAWRGKLLPQLGALDLVAGPMNRSAAVSLLRRIASETEFHAEGPESPVQVVGLLEAAGLKFRHLWVMGLHESVLPAPPRPNPFLPVSLQMEAGMPHAGAEREAAFAAKVAARLFAAAPRVILSHPRREGEAELLPSPLIRKVAEATVPLAPSHAPLSVWREERPPLEVLEDPCGPPLAPGEAIRGGTALLRDQALCPFRAFARHRLGAAALELPDIGLDLRERGNLLHKVMELFWSRTRTQANLLALGAEALSARIREAIEAGVQTLYPAGRSRPPEDLLALEKERIHHLISEWLQEVEAARAPFEVLEEEKAHTESFGTVEISTRVDRIDRLEDGRTVVLDYKTGLVDAADLVGERLIEPQLPIYGLGRNPPAAVAFARLRRGDCRFCGVAASGDILPKVKGLGDWSKARELEIGSWEELLAGWRMQLEELGRAFAAGEAAVDPVNDQKACRLCDLTSLCRIAEEPQGEEEEE